MNEDKLKWYQYLLLPIVIPLYLIHEKLVDWKIIRYWNYTEDGRIFKCMMKYKMFIKTPIVKIEKRFMKIKLHTYHLGKE